MDTSTVGPVDNERNGEDPVKDALAQARQLSRGKIPRVAGSRRGRPDPRRGEPFYSGARPDERDPQPVGAVLGEVVGARGWQRPLANARVFAEWAALVGADVAAHCRPTGLRAGELRIAAESTAWATQLRLLAGPLLQRLRGELGPEVVTKLVITGPTAPNWRHGPLFRPGRGPRDTYG